MRKGNGNEKSKVFLSFWEKLPAGIYLYKIESDKFLETRKMILLK